MKELNDLIKEEEDLYQSMRELIKGKQTSTVKSVLDSLSSGLINMSLVQ